MLWVWRSGSVQTALPFDESTAPELDQSPIVNPQSALTGLGLVVASPTAEITESRRDKFRPVMQKIGKAPGEAGDSAFAGAFALDSANTKTNNT